MRSMEINVFIDGCMLILCLIILSLAFDLNWLFFSVQSLNEMENYVKVSVELTIMKLILDELMGYNSVVLR